MVPLAYDLEGDWECVGCRWLRVLIRDHGPGTVYHSRCMDRGYERFKLTESPPSARPGEGEGAKESGGGDADE